MCTGEEKALKINDIYNKDGESSKGHGEALNGDGDISKRVGKALKGE